MKLTLYRHESSDQGTFGSIVLGSTTLFTGELPWRDNRSNRSCIPPGLYTCQWTYSPRFKTFTYLLDAVPERTVIRIHPANLMGDLDKGYLSQLNGCIALGERMGWMDKQKALLVSGPAVRRLAEYTGKRTFQLEIKWAGTNS